MVTVNLRAKGKISKLPKSIELSSSDKIGSLRQSISKTIGLSAARVRLTIPNMEEPPKSKDVRDAKQSKVKDIVLQDDEKKISDYSKDSILVFVRDMGPQIDWKTVFVIEYFGPLIIHPFFYYCQSFIYGSKFAHSRDQQLVFVFVMLHFLKREYETLFVHRFSLATMPVRNIFKNSGHYWVLSGFFMGYFVYAPPSYFDRQAGLLQRLLFSRQVIPLRDDYMYYALIALWVFSELSTFATHLNLASLRAPGTRDRKIPFGYGFNLVTCPNYFFEALAWTAVFLVSQNWSTFVFLIVSIIQMWFWAVKKHRRYRREFPDYPKNRKIMFPFFL